MWNERYADAFASYGTEPNDFLREVASQLPEGPVLCLAEGEGRNAVFLAERGHAVTAVDQSPVGLANAQKLAMERGVSLETAVADLADYDLGEGQWAAIVSVWAHIPPSIRVPLHAACVRALRPGGAMVLEAYTPRQLERPGVGGPPVTALLMTPDGLREELAGLRFERCAEVDRDVQEGRYHQGLSATVQVLGFKG
ncbi:MAG: class I SAM-dependent methyltransferase [Sandaracinaceae bacterium]